MRTSRNRLTALACAAMLALVACSSDTGGDSGGGGTAAGGGQEERVTIRLAASDQGPGYPTPYGAIRGPGRLMSSFIFDTLGFPDVTGDPKPWLARSWESTPDGKTWTFRLRDNVRWHDGRPFTADDVVFTFDYNLKGPGSTTGVYSAVNYIDTVTSPDPSTVVITTTQARPTFLTDVVGSFSGMSIMPKHIWESVTDPAKFQGDQALVGTGPYKLRQFDLTNNTFDFLANDDFYLGPPKVRELQIIKVGDPLLALQQGELDSATTGNGQSGTGAIPQSQIDALSRNFKMFTAPGEFNVALFFNQTRGFPYDQKEFRQAVAYALDRRDMVQRLLNGRGVPGPAGALGPANPFLNPRLPEYNHDLNRARSMLDQVGLRDANGDGVRDRPDGSPFAIPLLTSNLDTTTATLVSEQLRAAGLRVDLVTVDQPTSDARDTRGEYDMAIVHFGGLSSDPNGLTNRFASTSRAQSFTRVQGFRNAEFDRLAAEQAGTIDVNRRKELVNQMQAILADELPQLSLYVPEQIAFADTKKFNGWAYTPGCPPCGISLNKRNLVSGNAAPAPNA
ncbi:MAG TPA: ABC transporter substrate-binding protein [Acidimicrobiales bacterium]|nr:ABC transporter substrate-binding protein [Acidimicrobiales bacterium]